MRNVFYFFLLISNFSFGQAYYNSAKDKVFQLVPEDYGIVQGVVDSATALNNRYAIEQAMADAKSQKYKTFKVSNFDAFFEITHVTSTTNLNYYPFVEGINTISGLSLDFTNNATFRTFPNSEGETSLFVTTYSDNLTIKGGTYIGDRFEHVGGDQRGHLIHVLASANILVDGTTTKHAHGDGMKISSRYQTWQAEYVPSYNIIVRNSTQEENRRQGISITDGYNMLIENCRGIDNGTDINSSLGSLPKCWIDIEGQRTTNPDGSLRLDEYAHNLVIKNNYERGSGNASILVHIGDTVTVKNNDVEKGIVIDFASKVSILNNTIVTNGLYGVGINVSRENRSTFDNLIQGNYISGPATGINLGGKGARILNNEVYQTDIGLKVKDVRDAIVEDNIFDSNVSGSIGAYFHVTTADSLMVRNNKFKAGRDAAAFVNANNGNPNKRVDIIDNEFIGTRTIAMTNSSGFNFIDNVSNNGFSLAEIDNTTFTGNTINGGSSNAILFKDTMSGIIGITGNYLNSNTQVVRIDIYPSALTYENNFLNGTAQ